MKRKRRQYQTKVSRAIKPSKQEEQQQLIPINIQDECSQQAEDLEYSTDIEKMSIMCEMENDDVFQRSEQVVDHDVLLETAYQEIKELRASLSEQEAKCRELEMTRVTAK